MTKTLDQIIKQYTTPEQRKQFKNLSSKAKAALFNGVINYNKNTIKTLTKEEEEYLKSKGRSDLVSSSKSPLRQQVNYLTSKENIDAKIKYLNNPERIKQQGIDNVIAFLSVIGLKGVPKSQAISLVDKLSKVYKSGGKQAVTKLITTTRNNLVKQNPTVASRINQGVQRIGKAQKEFSDALDAIIAPKTGTRGVITKDIPMDQSAAADLRLKGLNQQLDRAAMRDGRVKYQVARQESNIATPDEFLNLGQPENPSLINTGDSTARMSELRAQAERAGTRANEIKNSISDEESRLLEFLRSVGEEGSVGQDLNKINKTVDKATSGFEKLSEGEAKNFTEAVKENAKELGKLAKECGVKSKKDLPGFLKFIKDTYNLISNAPNSIKASGLIAGGLAGLTIYDFYRSYKENGDSFAGLKTPMGRVIRHVLGYDGRDKLSKAAAKKAGLVDGMTEKQQKDYELGLFSQDLIDSEVPEFFSGASGRKYHNLNGYIYDFATGRPVDLNTAVNDFTQLLQYQDQQIIDKTNTINQQIADLQALQQQGYSIPQEQIQTLETQRDLLTSQQKEIKNQLNVLTSPDYDPNGDLTSQYKMNVVDPQQMQQQAQYAQINQQRLAYDEMYKKGYETIAQNTWDNLEKYYTPDQANVDYYEYSAKVANGQAPYMDVQSFYNMQKMKMMREAAPQIAQQAAQFAQNYSTAQKYTVDQDLTTIDINRKRDKDIADINQAYLNYQEDIRHNKVGEQISFGEYLVKKGQLGVQQANAETNRINAITNRSELGIKEYNAQTGRINAGANEARAKAYVEESPYRQFANMGSGFSGGAMGDVDPDTMINLNPNLGKKVAPKAFDQQATPQQPQANQPSLIDKALGLFRGN